MAKTDFLMTCLNIKRNDDQKQMNTKVFEILKSVSNQTGKYMFIYSISKIKFSQLQENN